MAVIKISISGINKLKLDELSTSAEQMRAGIFGHLTIFTGTLPYTSAAIILIINTYTSTRAAFKMGGKDQKNDFTLALFAIRKCMLDFAPIISEKANGNVPVLLLTGLPLTGNTNITAKLIKDGAVATGVVGHPGTTGQVITDCNPFGDQTQFIAILVPGDKMPEGTVSTLNGELALPPNTFIYYMNVNGLRKKTISGLPPSTFFWLYYLMIYGGVVSAYSVPVRVSSGS